MGFDLPDEGVTFDPTEMKKLDELGSQAAVGPYPQGDAYQDMAREHEANMNRLKDQRERNRH